MKDRRQSIATVFTILDLLHQHIQTKMGLAEPMHRSHVLSEQVWRVEGGSK